MNHQLEQINPAQIEIVQSRVSIDWEIVEEYAQAMRDGAAFPPINVFYDGAKHWCWDGCHRIHAARQAEKPSIIAIVESGSRRDALLAAAGANTEHGLRRSNDDKRRAVQMLLEDEEWSGWSDREIARRCNVDHVFVGKMRSSHTGDVTSMERTFIHPKTGKPTTMNTAPIADASRQRQETRQASVDPSTPRSARIEAAVAHLPASAINLARTVLARYGANYGDDRLNMVLEEIHTGHHDSVQKAIIAATQRSLNDAPAQVVHPAPTPQIDEPEDAGKEQRLHLPTRPAPKHYDNRSTPLAPDSDSVDDDEDEVSEQTYAFGLALLEGDPAAWKRLLSRLGIDVPEGEHSVEKLAAIVGHFTLYSNSPVGAADYSLK